MSDLRLQQLHHLLKQNRYPKSKQSILAELGCSESTLKRYIRKLRDDYRAPLVYIREQNGYRYTDEKFEMELPSLWGSPETLLTIVSMQKLLEHMHIDILDEHLNSLKQEIQRYLKRKKIATNQIERVRILPMAARNIDTHFLQVIIKALFERHCLDVTYHGRGTDKITQRIISLQRLVYYKENWHIDVWCHQKKAMRTFSLDCIKAIATSNEQCIDVNTQALEDHLAAGYGIFSGEATLTATLIFSAHRARWVADEIWHPQQKSTWLADGRYQLEIPYADDRELLMDIMRYLPEVEIKSPSTLKKKLIEHLQNTIQQHQK